MATNTVQVGRLVLREDLIIKEGSDGGTERQLELSGAESPSRLSAAQVAQRREDVANLPGSLVPVIFSQKTFANGYYEILEASGETEDWGGVLRQYRWSMSLRNVGHEAQVDLESRLSGPLSRLNDFAVVGDRIHCPPAGHVAYWSDAQASVTTARTGQDGVMTVYRGLPVTVNPRWSATPSVYGANRVRLLDENLFERMGSRVSVAPNGWELNNSLLRIRPNVSGATLEVSTWSGGAWRPKLWNVTHLAANMAPFTHCTVLRNEYEAITLRMTTGFASNIGRTTVDLTLRRGSRFLEIFLQGEFSGTLAVVRAAATASTAGNGYVVQTADDANGNRDIVGSTKTFTSDLANCGISKAATVELDAFIGSVVGGGVAVAGDAAVDLHKQYVGMPSEIVRAVRR